jgi:hypothetical protein
MTKGQREAYILTEKVCGVVKERLGVVRVRFSKRGEGMVHVGPSNDAGGRLS